MNTRDFNAALKFSLPIEGGYIDDPDDSGGATNHGVTQVTYDRYRRTRGLPTQPVHDITDTEVDDIYCGMYWVPTGCEALKCPLNVVMFDTAIQFGIIGTKRFPGAVRLLQRALGVEADGIIGAKTRAAIVAADPLDLALKLCEVRKARREERVQENPTQHKFLKGWLRRDNDLETYIKRL